MSSAVLLACSADLDMLDVDQRAWLYDRVHELMHQLRPTVVMLADQTPADGCARKRLGDHGARVLFYHASNVRMEYVGFRLRATAAWRGRVADLAMVEDLVAALERGWDVYALTLKHASKLNQDLWPLEKFLDQHARPGLLGNPEKYVPPTAPRTGEKAQPQP